MGQRHSRVVDGGRAFWSTERLWAAAAGLPVERVAIADIAEFDQDCWGHRIARAWLEGRDHVEAVRFVADPAPDHVERGLL